MAVYPWCQKCDRRRDAAKAGALECNDKLGHKRFVGWVADVRFGDGNKGKRLRKMFPHDMDKPKESAVDQAAAWKTDYKRGDLKMVKQTETLWGPLVDKYWVEHAVANGRNPEKHTFYIVEKWKTWIGENRKISPLTDAELQALQNDLRSLQRRLQAADLSGATINRQFAIGRSVCERGREWGLLKLNPFEHIADVKEDEPPLRFLEEREVDKLFETVNTLLSEYGKPIGEDRKKRLLDFMTVLYHTGARPSSIQECSFDNGDVDLENRVIWFTTYKGGRHRKKHRYPVPMDEEVFEIVQRRAKETGRRGPVFDYLDIPKLGRLVVAQSGVNEGKPENIHFTIYGLKHCVASHMIMKGASEAEVADLFGHTDTRMIHKHYKHLTMAHLRKVQGKVEFKKAELKVV